MYKRIALAVALAVSGQAVAAKKISNEELEKKGFAGEAELGWSSSSGNTDESSLRARAAAEYVLLDWRHGAEIRATNVQDEDSTKAENYFASYKIDRKWSADQYSFAALSYEDDRFKNKQDLVILSLGYGQTFKPAESVVIDTSIGPGYKWNQYVDPKTGEATKEWVLVAAAKMKWKLSETSKLLQKFSSKAGSDNVNSRSETSLTTNVMGDLAMKVSLILDHQTDPGFNKDGSDKESLDKVTAVTLLYSF